MFKGTKLANSTNYVLCYKIVFFEIMMFEIMRLYCICNKK